MTHRANMGANTSNVSRVGGRKKGCNEQACDYNRVGVDHHRRVNTKYPVSITEVPTDADRAVGNGLASNVFDDSESSGSVSDVEIGTNLAYTESIIGSEESEVLVADPVDALVAHFERYPDEYEADQEYDSASDVECEDGSSDSDGEVDLIGIPFVGVGKTIRKPKTRSFDGPKAILKFASSFNKLKDEEKRKFYALTFAKKDNKRAANIEEHRQRLEARKGVKKISTTRKRRALNMSVQHLSRAFDGVLASKIVFGKVMRVPVYRADALKKRGLKVKAPVTEAVSGNDDTRKSMLRILDEKFTAVALDDLVISDFAFSRDSVVQFGLFTAMFGKELRRLTRLELVDRFSLKVNKVQGVDLDDNQILGDDLIEMIVRERLPAFERNEDDELVPVIDPRTGQAVVELYREERFRENRQIQRDRQRKTWELEDEAVAGTRRVELERRQNRSLITFTGKDRTNEETRRRIIDERWAVEDAGIKGRRGGILKVWRDQDELAKSVRAAEKRPIERINRLRARVFLPGTLQSLQVLVLITNRSTVTNLSINNLRIFAPNLNAIRLEGLPAVTMDAVWELLFTPSNKAPQWRAIVLKLNKADEETMEAVINTIVASQTTVLVKFETNISITKGPLNNLILANIARPKKLSKDVKLKKVRLDDFKLGKDPKEGAV